LGAGDPTRRGANVAAVALANKLARIAWAVLARDHYGEKRVICYGTLAGRMVVVGYAPRGAVRHVFSMRIANDREKARIGPLIRLGSG